MVMPLEYMEMIFASISWLMLVWFFFRMIGSNSLLRSRGTETSTSPAPGCHPCCSRWLPAAALGFLLAALFLRDSVFFLPLLLPPSLCPYYTPWSWFTQSLGWSPMELPDFSLFINKLFSPFWNVSVGAYKLTKGPGNYSCTLHVIRFLLLPRAKLNESAL